MHLHHPLHVTTLEFRDQFRAGLDERERGIEHTLDCITRCCATRTSHMGLCGVVVCEVTWLECCSRELAERELTRDRVAELANVAGPRVFFPS